MRVFPGFLLSVTLLVAGLPLSQSRAAGTTTIAAFGDSLFSGYGISPQYAFPQRLEQRLLAKGYDVRVLNLGVSGDTSAGGLARVDHVIAQKPDIVILELGGNDLLRALPPAATQDNLDAILQKLTAARIQVVLTGHVAPLNYGRQFADAYNAVFPALSAKYGVALYPSMLSGVVGHAELMQADGVHPNAQGVDVMVGNLLPWITRLLKK